MNSKSFLKFTIGLLQFVVIMAVIAAYPLYKFVPQRLLFALGESLLFFVCLTLLIFGFIVRRAKKGNEILNGYFLSIAIKMFIGLIYFVVILQDYKDQRRVRFILTVNYKPKPIELVWYFNNILHYHGVLY